MHMGLGNISVASLVGLATVMGATVTENEAAGAELVRSPAPRSVRRAMETSAWSEMRSGHAKEAAHAPSIARVSVKEETARCDGSVERSNHSPHQSDAPALSLPPPPPPSSPPSQAPTLPIARRTQASQHMARPAFTAPPTLAIRPPKEAPSAVLTDDRLRPTPTPTPTRTVPGAKVGNALRSALSMVHSAASGGVAWLCAAATGISTTSPASDREDPLPPQAADLETLQADLRAMHSEKGAANARAARAMSHAAGLGSELEHSQV